MRRWAWLMVVGLLAGCKAKHEASSGKEWLEKFQAAAKAKDAETCWKMFSKDTQKQMTDSAKSIKEMAGKSKDMDKTMKETLKLDKNPSECGEEELAKKMMFGKDGAGDEMGKVKFVEEKSEGDKVILVTQTEGKDKKDEVVLVKEDGYLKLDMKAMMEREKAKPKG